MAAEPVNSNLRNNVDDTNSAVKYRLNASRSDLGLASIAMVPAAEFLACRLRRL